MLIVNNVADCAIDVVVVADDDVVVFVPTLIDYYHSIESFCNYLVFLGDSKTQSWFQANQTLWTLLYKHHEQARAKEQAKEL